MSTKYTFEKTVGSIKNGHPETRATSRTQDKENKTIKKIKKNKKMGKIRYLHIDYIEVTT